MGLTRVSIVRPLFITMAMLGLVVIGLVSYTRLGVDLLPAINFPLVSVVVRYPGASPEAVEQLVVRPIEDALAGEGNLDFMVSQATEGQAVVSLVYRETADVDVAAINVERKVNAIRGALPTDVLPPSVVRADVNAQPVMNLSVSGDRSPAELFRIADEQIVPRLSAAGGVASASLSGGLESEVVVKVDFDKLRAYGLSILRLNQVLAAENQNVPAGTITDGGRDYSVRFDALFATPERIRDTVVAALPSGTVYVRDVADVSLGYKRVTRLQRTDGKDAIGVLITKQSDANTLQVSEGVRRALRQLERQLPPDVRVEVVSDQAIFTRESLDDVRHNVIEAVVLTGLVLLVFLHTLRSTFIVLLAIPTSLVATFIMMYAFGFTLNMMSLMALALTVGILVDDSIVVLENIFRHLELGENRYVAALKGRSEIGLAAITITLVDVVVYAPVAFMSGIVGQYFQQFGLVIACATLFSLLVSFTLTPMLASRWLTLPDRASRNPLAAFGRWWERRWTRLEAGYRRVLRWSLRWRWLTIGAGVASLVAGIGLVTLGWVSAEFMPATDQSQLIATLEMPPGTSLETTSAVTRQVEERFAAWPEVRTLFTTVGTSGAGQSSQPRFARVVVELVKPYERARGPPELALAARALGEGIPGLKMRVGQASFAGPGGPPVQVLVRGQDGARVRELADRVEEIVRRTPGTADATNSASEGAPELQVTIDRQRAADLGLSAAQVAQALRTGISGSVVTQWRVGGQKSLDVRVIASDADRASIDRLREVPLVTSRSTQVRLGQVAEIRPATGPSQIDRRDRQRVVTISAELAGRPLGDVSADVQRELARLELPPGYSVSLGGQTEAQNESFGQIGQALLLSFLLMYMLMVALYESLLSPFIVMLSLPLAVVGAIAALWLTGNTLNMLSLIGMIMLAGLVGKNAILLVDYANTLRRRGLDRDAALLEAGPIRLRPIAMTTATMVVAMLPVAARLGEGSELRAPMAVVVIGGLISSTLLTLVMIPAVYTVFDDLQGWFGRAFGLRRAAGAPPVEDLLDGSAQPERELVPR